MALAATVVTVVPTKAEWDLGSLSASLLTSPDIVLRSDDPKFMEPGGSGMSDRNRHSTSRDRG
jgi:hypothetical protein